ncbi:MAG: Stp1/IreP family PP2C-type Ser/Thr phosphatase [Chloroflexota bacterium]|nr:MAG: Stp1/IreP family PP2C-type Ser/Thr phosphatase [Chloroflexota bacterium]
MHGPKSGARLHSSASTSVGQVRENNEDNVHLWLDDDLVLAIVADGMGGAAAGEEASRLAVETVQTGLALAEQSALRAFEPLADDSIAQKLRDVIRAANSDIMRRAAADPQLRGMGTTVTLAFVRNNQVIVAHVGDSRAYLVSRRDRSIHQITADHSFVEALVAAGHITQEQAEDHPMRNVLYRALGQTEDIDVDVYHSRLLPGDRLILCSDGLTRHVKSAEIATIALSDDDPDVISERLIQLTNDRGGEDNVSVVVIVLEDSDEDALDEQAAIENDTLVLNRPLSELLNLDETRLAELHRSSAGPDESDALPSKEKDEPPTEP